MAERWAENPKVVGSILTLDIVVFFFIGFLVFCLLPNNNLNLNFFMSLNIIHFIFIYFILFIFFLLFQTKTNSRLFLLFKYISLFNYIDLLFVFIYKNVLKLVLFFTYLFNYLLYFLIKFFTNFLHNLFIF